MCGDTALDSVLSQMVANAYDTTAPAGIFTAAKTGGIRNYFVEMSLDLMRFTRYDSHGCFNTQTPQHRKGGSDDRHAPSSDEQALVSMVVR